MKERPGEWLMKLSNLSQHQLLRALNNTRVKDRVSIKFMLEKFGLLSVNQLAAKIKLAEVWKSIHCPDYPIELEPYTAVTGEKNYRLPPQRNRIFNDSCRLKRSEESFNIDAARLWNAAPIEITTATTLTAGAGSSRENPPRRR